MESKLPKIVSRSKKRVGRGYGSGKGGHTSGRGQKGQKSRNSVHLLFEGVKTKKSLLKRLPLMRGKGKFKAKAKPVIVQTSVLNSLPAGTKVTVELLVKEGMVDARLAKANGVKVLKDVELTKKLVFEVPTSKSVGGATEVSVEGEKKESEVSKKTKKSSK
jgi:large subunit ribosomal protein L15